MTLESEFIARLSVQRVNELTNPQLAAGGTYDAVRLARAATDVRAAFKFGTGIDFDDNLATHIEIGIMGLVCRLKKIAGEPAAFSSPECVEWDSMIALLRTGHMLPQTSSVLQPSQEQAGALPDSDRRNFGDVVPRQHSADRGDELNGWGSGR